MTKIKMLRLQQDLKAVELSKKLGIHQSVLSVVESGKAKASDATRLKLSGFFGLPERELFDDERYARQN
jgi:transcriptional regulator with XRE-family HTH domain